MDEKTPPSNRHVNGDGTQGQDKDNVTEKSNDPQVSQLSSNCHDEFQFEKALAFFYSNRTNTSSFKISSLAIDCALSLTICYSNFLIQGMTRQGTNFEHFVNEFSSSSLIQSVVQCKKKFAAQCIEFKKKAGVNELFADLVDMEISTRYEPKNININDVLMEDGYSCNLDKVTNCKTLKYKSDIILLKERDVHSNFVEDARFAIRMVILLDLLCRSYEEMYNKLSNNIIGPTSLRGGGLSSRWSRVNDKSVSQLQTTIDATEEIRVMGGLFSDKPKVGSDLDICGRTFFYFTPLLDESESVKTRGFSAFAHGSIVTDKDRRRHLADRILMRASKRRQMVLVIDPTELFIVKPRYKDGGVDRGTILCCTPLRNILAAATDGEWLHVAMRHVDDVGVLIKKGNMALRFDSAATSLVVKECLEKYQRSSNSVVLDQVDTFLQRQAEGMVSWDY